MHRLRIALLFAATVTFGAVPVAAAQESTASPTPIEVDACSTEPLSFEELSTTMATPVAETADTAAPAASPVPVELPEGESADDETATAVQDTIKELTACLNEGKLLNVLALYSDRFIQATFAGSEITEQVYNEQLVPEQPVAEAEQVLIYSFGDVVITDDGRAAIVAVGDDLSSPDPASPTLFYLVQDGDEWKLDETVESDED
jgi:hypothetical protein